MIKNMAEGCDDFEIIMNRKAKSAIWQHCDFVKDEVFKTKIACRHCQIVLKLGMGSISYFSN